MTESIPREATDAYDEGNVAMDEKRLDDAEIAFLRATEIAPTWESPWFNLGVIYKWRARWPDARRCIERTLELETGNREGALWNRGIVATALGDWEVARKAWRSYGIKIPDGTGPIDGNFGMTPVRMRVEGSEVVWCDRIDPARAIVRSIPLPESGRRFGDLLLHDGAPNGYRLLDGKECAVFDELELIAASEFHTYAFDVRSPSEAATRSLLDAFDGAELSAEDWTDSVRLICKQCSEGHPHEHAHHENEERAEWAETRMVGVASRDRASIVGVLERWARGGIGDSLRRLVGGSTEREFESPECVVQGTGSS